LHVSSSFAGGRFRMQLLVLDCKLLRLVLFHVPFAFDSMNDFYRLDLTFS
jgi:hypothetical protein